MILLCCTAVSLHSTLSLPCPFLQRYYIPAARELQRIESISRSPIYSKFSEALAGVATIRAFRKEEYFTVANDGLLQQNAYAYVTQRAAAGWLALRLDMVGVCILTLAGRCRVLEKRGAPPTWRSTII